MTQKEINKYNYVCKPGPDSINDSDTTLLIGDILEIFNGYFVKITLNDKVIFDERAVENYLDHRERYFKTKVNWDDIDAINAKTEDYTKSCLANIRKLPYFIKHMHITTTMSHHLMVDMYGYKDKKYFKHLMEERVKYNLGGVWVAPEEVK